MVNGPYVSIGLMTYQAASRLLSSGLVETQRVVQVMISFGSLTDLARHSLGTGCS